MGLGAISKEGGTVLMLVWAPNSMAMALTSDLALVVLKSLIPDGIAAGCFTLAQFSSASVPYLKELTLDLIGGEALSYCLATAS